jgi:hypothetical protein
LAISHHICGSGIELTHVNGADFRGGLILGGSGRSEEMLVNFDGNRLRWDR